MQGLPTRSQKTSPKRLVCAAEGDAIDRRPIPCPRPHPNMLGPYPRHIDNAMSRQGKDRLRIA